MREFAIGGHRIAADAPVFIIAEIGVNHNGDVALAKDMIVAAKQAGADCVKFQTFEAERVATATADKAQYQLRSTDPGESQVDMLRKLELPEAAYPELLAFCAAQKIMFLSSPYSIEDIDLLARYGVSAYKVASALCVEPAFLRRIGQERKPVILSTGMADLPEIEEAIAALRMGGTEEIVLLQCTTDYPALLEDTNLRAMQTLATTFDLPVGYSDHTPSLLPGVLAVALGGRVIEKHFTTDKSMPGPDQSTSADPAEFAALVHAIREAETAMGSALKQPTERERINARGMRRSVVSKVAIAAGTAITADMLTFKRPATGIAPRDLDKLVGGVATKDIPADALLDWSWIERRS